MSKCKAVMDGSKITRIKVKKPNSEVQQKDGKVFPAAKT